MSEASNSCISRNVISSTLVPGELTDLQLDVELTIAASAPGRLRFKRYEELLSEALARGIPVVTTSVGAQGFDVRAGVHLLLADTAEDFSRAVITLLADAQLRERIGKSGQAVAANGVRQ